MKKENNLTKYKVLHDGITADIEHGLNCAEKLYIFSAYLLSEMHESEDEDYGTTELVFKKLFANAISYNKLSWVAETFVFLYIKMDCAHLFENDKVFNTLSRAHQGITFPFVLYY